MKPRTLSFLTLAIAATTASAYAVQVGDSRDAVIRELGKPDGEIVARDSVILVYPRGEIRLRDDKVSGVKLLTEQQLAARREAEARERAQFETDRASRRTRLESEGRALYEAKKNDPAFATLPVRDQLAFWRSFAGRYPMIPIGDDVAELRARFEQDERMRATDSEMQAQMADLEARVTEAEDRAARAEQEARRARYNNGSIYGPFFPSHRRPSPPVAIPDAPPPGDPMDAARAKADREYEEARRKAYAPDSP